GRADGVEGEFAGGGGEARGLGRVRRGGADRGGADGARCAPVLGLEWHLPVEGRRAGARTQHCAGGPRPDRGRGGRLRDGGGRGQQPGRRGRARGRELPGVFHPHPLGDSRLDQVRGQDRRPVRRRLRHRGGFLRRGRAAARRASWVGGAARRQPRRVARV
ncbi:MAG: hypothetical protein AVDCRST_MAG55-2995, partial [uncultured Rubrobacteraceae bacterium]